MANISVTVQDGNNITLVSTPTATQVITIDRGIAGPAGPAGVPGGSTTQIQYNLASAFAGSPNFTFNGSNLVLQSASASDAFRITQTGAGNALVVEDSANPDTTPFVIDNTGRVIVGYTTRFAPDVNAPTIFPQVSVFGVSATAQYSAFSYINAAANAPVVSLSKSRGATIGTNTIVAINDTIGIVKFTAADGTAFVPAASISAQVDGTPGLNDMPGRLVFNTTADGAATSTERMRIDSAGNVGIGTITPNSELHIARNDATSYDGAATDGQLAAGSTLFIQQTSSTNTGVAQIVFQPRSTFPYNRIVSSGGSAPFMTFITNNAERLRIDSAGAITISSGTANGVAYLNGSKVLTTGTAMVFDGTNLGVGGTSPTNAGYTNLYLNNTSGAQLFLSVNGANSRVLYSNAASLNYYISDSSPHVWHVNASEQMRLTSTGLGIGTASPGAKLDVQGTAIFARVKSTGTTYNGVRAQNDNGNFYFGLDDASGAFYGTANARVLYSDGAYPMVFYTNATERMRLDSAGNLGVGTTSPSTRLHTSIAGATIGARFQTTTGTTESLIEFKDPNTTADYKVRIGSAGDAMRLYSGGTVTATLDSAGNLGLGVTPSAWYVANSNRAIQIGSYLSLLADNQNGYASLANNAYQSTINQASGWNYVTTNAAAKYTQTLGSHAWYNAPSGTAGNAITFTQAMTLDASGNLGVGTTSPTTKLHISSGDLGGATFSGSYNFGSPNYNIRIINNGNTLGYISQVPAAGGIVVADGMHYYGGGPWLADSTSAESIQMVGGNIVFTTNAGLTGGGLFTPAERMRLDSAGNLGIGTTSPGAKLELYGSYANAKWNDGTRTGVIAINSDGSDPQFRFESNSTFVFANTSGTKFATLDSAGNLGLGVTPSAWGDYRAFQIGVGASIASAAETSVVVSSNAYNTSASGWKYRTTNSSAQYEQFNGGHYWSTAPSGTAGNAITFTQAMTLDASGRLGLGTTSPNTKLELRTDTTTAGSEANIFLNNRVAGTTPYYSGGLFGGGFRDVRDPAYIAGIDFYRDSAVGGVASAGSIRFYTDGYGENLADLRANCEKMRLDANGNLLVGTTSPAGSERFNVTGSVANNIARFVNNNAASYGTLIQYGSGIDPNGTGNEFIDCRANVSTLRFNVRSNGGITNYQANNVNLSDRREKINFAPAGEYLSKICAIPVQTFNYIDQNMEEDSGLTLGVIAQDVQAVAPELVAESNWGTRNEQKLRLSIYQTDLQYALMKCIQEQQALITTLTDRITALEAK